MHLYPPESMIENEGLLVNLQDVELDVLSLYINFGLCDDLLLMLRHNGFDSRKISAI